jgi:hypothetical protein
MLIRGYLSTCRKNGVGYSKAIMAINENKLPEFINVEPTGDIELKGRIRQIRKDKDQLEMTERIELFEAVAKKREKAMMKEEKIRNMAEAAAVKAGNIRLEEAA